MIVVVKLVVIFLSILLFIRLTKLLPVAVLAASVVTVILFQMNVRDTLVIAGKAAVSQLTIYTLLAFYSIMFLQRMLEKRNLLIEAQQALNVLPDILSGLPVPRYIVFVLIFFAGTIIVGQQAINVIALPIAFAAIPDGGVSLLMLLMATGYAAMQVSPTHICLAIVIEYFKTDLGSLVKKTIPVIACFFAILIPYYLLLNLIL